MGLLEDEPLRLLGRRGPLGGERALHLPDPLLADLSGRTRRGGKGGNRQRAGWRRGATLRDERGYRAQEAGYLAQHLLGHHRLGGGPDRPQLGLKGGDAGGAGGALGGVLLRRSPEAAELPAGVAMAAG